MAGDPVFVVVRAFSQPYEAYIARSALRAAGIDATVADDNIVSVDWLYSNAVGGVKLLVPADEAGMAGVVLDTPPIQMAPSADTSGSGTVPDADACPHCGSGDVAPVMLGKRLQFLTWLVAGVPLLPAFRRTRCRTCGHRWRRAAA